MQALQEYVCSRSFLQAMEMPAGATPALSLLGQGEYNANYVFDHPCTGKKLVLRVNTGSQMHLKNQIAYEFHALRALEKSGRTPRAVFYDDSRAELSHGVLVMEWLPGRPLRYETDMETAAHIFADIHSLPVPADSHLIRPAHPAQAIYEECVEMASQYFNWNRADAAVCALLATLIEETGKLPLRESSPAARCMVNTEVNAGNFLINEDAKSYLVDWEKPLVSEPAQDLGHFLAPTTTFWKTDVILKPEQIRHFVGVYKAAVGGRMELSTLEERLPLFFTVTCLRGLTWCAMARREYERPDRALFNADTFFKIRQYLSEDFLRNILENYVRRDFLLEEGGA